MAEMTQSEVSPKGEIPQQTAFDQMQAFLTEKGGLINREIPGTLGIYSKERLYEQPYFISIKNAVDVPGPVRFLAKISPREDVRADYDLTVSQKQDAAGSPQDILITLTDKRIVYKARKKNREIPDYAEIHIRLKNSKAELEDSNIKAEITRFPLCAILFGLKWQDWMLERDYFVTESEEETEKIVTTLLKNFQGREKEAKRQVERRGLLNVITGGAKLAVLDSILAHIPLAPSLSKSFWEQLETATLGLPPEQLKKEIEDKFHIEIVGPSTGVMEVDYFGRKVFPTVEWDSPRLKGLIGALSELPPHLILPRKIDNEERKVRFALTDVPDWEWWLAGKGREWAGFCACHAAKNQLIVFDKKYLGQTFLESGSTRKDWFHEVTHALTTPEIAKYSRLIIEPLGVGKEGLRSLFSKEFTPVDKDFNARIFVNAVLKSKIKTEEYIVTDNMFAVRKDFYFMMGEQFFRNALEAYWQKEQEEKGSRPILSAKTVYEIGFTTGDIPSIKDKSKLGYGVVNLYEFFSVAAEYYSKGKGEFVKTYEPFLGKERAEKLYGGMKQEIFRGREY